MMKFNLNIQDIFKSLFAALFFSHWLISPAHSFDIERMKVEEIKLFTYLENIYPFDENLISTSAKSKLNGELKIWSANPAEECDASNEALACKQHKMYIVVSDEELGGKRYGFSLPKAYRWEVLSIEQLAGSKRCISIKLKQRVLERKGVWLDRLSDICISSRGLVSTQ